MMLKKFLYKTIKAAKESAQQMYGDDFTIVETLSSGNKQEDKEDVSEDYLVEDEHKLESEGVKFERSSVSVDKSEADISPTLKAIRKYAEKQTSHETENLENGRVNSQDENSEETGDSSLRQSPQRNVDAPADMYSRRSIRLIQSYNDTTNRQEEGQQMVNNIKAPKSELSESPFSAELNRSVLKKTEESTDTASPISDQMQDEIDTLHNRIDKIEELLQIILQDLGVTSKKPK